MSIPPELLNAISELMVWLVVITTATAVALWISMAIWAFRDIRARSLDPFAWILAALLVVATGPLGLLLYYLLRPRETLAEVYDRQLEEEALLRDISARRACPQCQAVTEPEWLLCPHCSNVLRCTCEQCSRPLELDWVACPYCMHPVLGREPSGNGVLPKPVVQPQPVLRRAPAPPAQEPSLE